MEVELRRPQKIAFKFLARTPRAYLLADMGLGKTLVCLEAIDFAEMMDGPQTVLVVAPKRVATVTWPSECAKWGRPRPKILHGAKWPVVDGPGIYCVTYAGLRRLRKEVLKNGRKCPFNFVVYDESTAAKNPSSKRINSVRGVFHRNCKRIVALTGTPIANNYQDVFAQIRILDGGERLGGEFNPWRNQWFYPDPEDFSHHKWLPHGHTPDVLTRKISDITCVLKKKDYPELEIPPIVEHDIEVKMPDEVRAQYNEIRRALRLTLRKKRGRTEEERVATARTAATLSSKLLQICSGLIIVDGEMSVPSDPFELPIQGDSEPIWVSDHKIDAVKELVGDCPEPTLLMYQFIDQKRRLVEAFNAVSDITEETVDAWNRREIPWLVGHHGGMGHGLNLQYGGNRIIWVSPPWSQEGYGQANCRLARPGSEDGEVNCYRLFCPDTVEELVLEALRAKVACGEEFIDFLRRFL